MLAESEEEQKMALTTCYGLADASAGCRGSARCSESKKINKQSGKLGLQSKSKSETKSFWLINEMKTKSTSE